jgi:hypothetical protein
MWMQTYRRDLSGDIDTLRDFNLARFKRTFQVHVLDLLAKGRLGADQTDQTVLHGEKNICALLNLLLDDAAGGDKEFLATASR